MVDLPSRIICECDHIRLIGNMKTIAHEIVEEQMNIQKYLCTPYLLIQLYNCILSEKMTGGQCATMRGNK